MKPYNRRALNWAIILVFLGCFSAGGWLVFQGLLNDRNSKIDTRKSKLENRSWRLTHQGFPTASSSSLANLVAANVPSAFQPSPPWGRGWTAAGAFPSRGGPGEGVHAKARVVESYGRIPLSFEANAGQTDSRVKFLSRGAGYTLFLTGDEAVLALKKSGVRSQESEARRSKLEIGNPKFETRNSKIEIGNWKIETGERKLESRNSKLESAPGIPRPLIPHLEAAVHASGLRTAMHDSRASGVLRMRLLGANPAAKVSGEEELPGKANYFIGNDAKKWRSSVPTYAKVRYKDVYRGVDLVYYGSQRQLEYDFEVAPAADPSSIALAVEVGEGASSKAKVGVNGPCRIDSNGDLVVRVEGEDEVRFHKPVAYQEQESGVRSQRSEAQSEARNSKFENRQSTIENRQSVEAGFVLDAQNRVHFALGPYDHTRPLVVDPVLVYSTCLGGGGEDVAYGIAVDGQGNVYVAGSTTSPNFPTENALQANLTGAGDAFVAKLNWDASNSTLSLVYSTYLGGSAAAGGIAVDSSGNAYVTGSTASFDFPTVNAFQASDRGMGDTAFVTKLNSTGSALVYSTYLGGSSGDYGNAIAVDSSGNAYVTGLTDSDDFPTASPLQGNNHCSNGPTAFVTKLNSTGSALIYSTYLGGSTTDMAYGIAVDSSGNAYVTGTTWSSDFPTANALQPSLLGEQNAFVAKLNWAPSSTGLSLVYSTYLGGNNMDVGTGIAVDSSENAYVAGWTDSDDFPTAYPLETSGGIFVTKLNWDASTSTLSLVYSTRLEGGEAYAIAVDSYGNAYVTGNAASGLATVNPVQASLGGGSSAENAFVAELNWDASTSTLSLAFSTYLGGSHYDWGNSIAVDSYGNIYLAGITESSNFPTANPIQASLLGSGNAFAAKIGTANSPGVAFGPGALSFANQGVGTTSGIESVTLTAAGSQPLGVTSITPSRDFALANTATSCPYSGGTVPSATTCTIDVTFTPSIAGTRTGSLTITDDAAGSPQTVSLKGNFPTVTSLSPSPATTGGPAFTLTVTGTDFVSGSGVQWDGSARATTFVSATQLTATILASDIATGGIASVAVLNPSPGGGTSNALAYTIDNPVPTVASLSPSSVLAEGLAFTMTVTGTNFVPGSWVRFNGQHRPTTFLSATQVTATILASDIAEEALLYVGVENPQPGGGESNLLTFQITVNPSPRLTLRSPSGAMAGGPAFTLTVDGSNFISSSVVQWNGSDRSTTFVSNTELTTAILASDIATAGTASITVFNPPPGGGKSNAAAFIINNPVPTAASLSPSSATAGGPAFTLTVRGTNFVSTSTVQWDGTALTTTYVSSTQLTASVPASDIAKAGTARVRVLSPSPGGGPTSDLHFTINNPVPTATLLSPSSATPGGAAFTLTVTGTNFLSTSTVAWNGKGLTTSYVSSTQLTASVPASDIATAGTALITVSNPAPGGGKSNAVAFTINNPVPTAASLSPPSATAGGPALTMTVMGTNFVSTSTVQWDGTALTTTYVSSTQSTASVPASDIATAGTARVRVLSPSPGGGPTSDLHFTINNPVPTATLLSPSSATAGGPAFTLTVTGTKFLSTSTVAWNGKGLTTTYVSSAQLTASVPASDIAKAGTASVTVANPSPGGGTSNALTFTLTT
jgi:hypothetical protein